MGTSMGHKALTELLSGFCDYIQTSDGTAVLFLSTLCIQPFSKGRASVKLMVAWYFYGWLSFLMAFIDRHSNLFMDCL